MVRFSLFLIALPHLFLLLAGPRQARQSVDNR
jgi:hypothetical protein